MTRQTFVFRTEIIARYPGLPAPCVREILNWAFRPGAVGYDTRRSLERRVFLAVRAHARHAHSNYEILLEAAAHEASKKRLIRQTIRAQTRMIMAEWQMPQRQRQRA